MHSLVETAFSLAFLVSSANSASDAAGCGIQARDTNAPIAGWTHMGCYEWSSPALSSSYSLADQPDVTWSKCAAKCEGSGANYWGIAEGYTCYCGASLLRTPKNTSENDCWYHCSGDAEQWCGGPGRIDLFSKGTDTRTTATRQTSAAPTQNQPSTLDTTFVSTRSTRSTSSRRRSTPTQSTQEYPPTSDYQPPIPTSNYPPQNPTTQDYPPIPTDYTPSTRSTRVTRTTSRRPTPTQSTEYPPIPTSTQNPIPTGFPSNTDYPPNPGNTGLPPSYPPDAGNTGGNQVPQPTQGDGQICLSVGKSSTCFGAAGPTGVSGGGVTFDPGFTITRGV